jgi:hypothetical protein
MSIGSHANTVTFSLRKLMSVYSYLWSTAAPMRAVLVMSPETSSTSLVSLDFAAAQSGFLAWNL